VGQHLAERLIFHGNIRLAADRIAKLGLNHGKGGFDVAPLVVMGRKLVLLEREQVEHLLPNTFVSAKTIVPPIAGRIDLKRDKRRGADCGNGVVVVDRRMLKAAAAL
jgi:hypothetical protein